MHHDARTINIQLTYSLKGCILIFGLLRRGLSEDLFEACSKSPSFFDSPFVELSRPSYRESPRHDRPADDIRLL